MEGKKRNWWKILSMLLFLLMVILGSYEYIQTKSKMQFILGYTQGVNQTQTECNQAFIDFSNRIVEQIKQRGFLEVTDNEKNAVTLVPVQDCQKYFR